MQAVRRLIPSDGLSVVPHLDHLFFESTLDPELHAQTSKLETKRTHLAANRVVSTNVSEQMAELHTERLRAVGEYHVCEV